VETLHTKKWSPAPIAGCSSPASGYIREVDPYEKIMTGMTRDGLYLVENGKVTSAVRNFRFNQSLIELLQNVEAMSPASRATAEEAFEMIVPAMKVKNFHLTEPTKF
jgi:predicted Zn-dependent protease